MKNLLPGIDGMGDDIIAELYTIRLSNGTMLYYTTLDADIAYRGAVYKSGDLILDRTSIKCSEGITVDEVTVSVYGNAPVLGVSVEEFTRNGGFDGAWVKIERARLAYVVHLFEGTVSDANYDREKVSLTLSSGTIFLNVSMPRNIYQSGCGNILFDSACGLLKENFVNAFTVLAGSSKSVIYCSSSPRVSGYFNSGTVTFNTGGNSGASRSVKSYKPGEFLLSYPLDITPGAGDTFSAYPGCNKVRQTCKDKFNNELRYRAFPFIPTPEAAI